jgi:signal peptidase II
LTSKRLKRTTRNTFIFVLAAAAAILIDQVSKALVVAYVEPGRSITMVPHVLSLTHSTNTGGAFGLMRGSGQIVFLAALVVVGLTMAWFFVFRGRKSFWTFLGLGLLIGGALGNLIDRVARHKVVDFLDLGWWPVFNVADIAIVAGVIIVVVVSARELWQEENIPENGGA